MAWQTLSLSRLRQAAALSARPVYSSIFPLRAINDTSEQAKN